MPLYEYACSVCHDRFERLSSISEGATSECPACGTVSKRVVSLMAAPVMAGVGASVSSAGAVPMAGGCCGGSCACG
jgi:putative FmdB family regulatory protein